MRWKRVARRTSGLESALGVTTREVPRRSLRQRDPRAPLVSQTSQVCARITDTQNGGFEARQRLPKHDPEPAAQATHRADNPPRRKPAAQTTRRSQPPRRRRTAQVLRRPTAAAKRCLHTVAINATNISVAAIRRLPVIDHLTSHGRRTGSLLIDSQRGVAPARPGSRRPGQERVDLRSTPVLPRSIGDVPVHWRMARGAGPFTPPRVASRSFLAIDLRDYV